MIMLYMGWINQLTPMPVVNQRTITPADLTGIGLIQPIYGMITFQRSKLLVDRCTKKAGECPQTVFCGGGAETKWQSGYARLLKCMS